MTYKLEPILEKIVSTVSLVFPDGSNQIYKDGREAAETVFDRRYVISSMRVAEGKKIEIELIESDNIPSVSSF